MQPGGLRHRISIQYKPQAQDDWGEPIDQWSDRWTNVPAAIEHASGNEFWSAQQVQSTATSKITIRWRSGVKTDMRIVHQTSLQAGMSPPEMDIYDIVSVLPDTSGRRWLEIMCTQRHSPGFRTGDDPSAADDGA